MAEAGFSEGGHGISRRGLLLSTPAIATGAALLRPAAAPAAIAAQAEVVRRGRAIAVSPNGRRVVVAHEQRRTIAIGSRLVNVGGEPIDVAISPDGRIAAVTTAFWDGPGLAVVSLRDAEVRARIAVGPAPHSVTFAGGRIVVTGGEQEGGVWIVDARRMEVVAHAPVGICPRGVAAAPGREAAWLSLNGDDAVVRVSARTGKVQRELRTPPLPDRIAVSRDGRRLLLTHAGPDADRVSEIDTRTRRISRHRAGRFPTGVAYSRAGRRLVALGGDGAIVTPGGRRRPAGGAPRGLAVAGRHAWTVDGLTGRVTRVAA